MLHECIGAIDRPSSPKNYLTGVEPHAWPATHCRHRRNAKIIPVCFFCIANVDLARMRIDAARPWPGSAGPTAQGVSDLPSRVDVNNFILRSTSADTQPCKSICLKNNHLQELQ
jgi:hypothetical protein